MTTQLHKDLDAIPPAARGAIAAIGNFDGLHLGHQALVQRVQHMAGDLGAPAAVMTFEPHPREFFAPDAPPFRLTLLPMKQRVLAAWGVNHLFTVPFNAALASLSPEAFIDDILVAHFGLRHIVVGHDFAFGKGRAGNVDTLRAAAAAGKFGLTVVDPVNCPDGSAYSSTRIRQHVQKAEFAEAEALLGRPFEIEAPVVHGDKRGRELGYPTANQQAGRYVRLPYGIYAVSVLVEGEKLWRAGVANFGVRPMFRIEQPIFESFIFEFSGDIYDKQVRVRPLKYLRGEAHFDSLEALKDQMNRDCLEARAVVKSS
ncbi:MAG: bifunctional riboflavin kinase/FAD synthetase [Micavibrio sp.]|nr:bifunctional riboflavin kinase/FAD synthetase [Micavibrio sp.]